MKKCACCGEYKEVSQFNRNKQKKDGLSCYCKVCERVKRRKAYDSYGREFRLKNIDIFRVRERRRNLKKYNITPEDYDSSFSSQSGRCAVCKCLPEDDRNKSGRYKNLCVDHDHKNGEVRGLLCSNCNAAVGLFEDNVEYLHEAIKYLRNYQNDKQASVACFDLFWEF